MLFRSELNLLNNISIEDNLSPDEISGEVNCYYRSFNKVFGLFKEEELIGFLVLKCEDKVYWLDWMYLLESERGREGASELFDHAENFVKGTGESQLYIWVHPHNKRMLRFLAKKGYNTMNLIEITKGNVIPEYDSSMSTLSILGSEFQLRPVKDDKDN